MSDLDDFNRRMTMGDMAGAPKSLGDVAAQMHLDAQRHGNPMPSGGGSVDVSLRRAAVLLTIGVVLLGAGAFMAIEMEGGYAIMGGAVAVVGAGLSLFFGLGVLIAGLHRIGLWRIALAIASGVVAWGVLTPWLTSHGMALPGWLVGTLVFALVLLILRRRSKRK